MCKFEEQLSTTVDCILDVLNGTTTANSCNSETSS